MCLRIIIALSSIYLFLYLTRVSQTLGCITWRVCYNTDWWSGVGAEFTPPTSSSVILMLLVQDHTLKTTAVDKGLAISGLICVSTVFLEHSPTHLFILSMAVFMATVALSIFDGEPMASKPKIYYLAIYRKSLLTAVDSPVESILNPHFIGEKKGHKLSSSRSMIAHPMEFLKPTFILFY